MGLLMNEQAQEERITEYAETHPSYHAIHDACKEFIPRMAELNIEPDYIVGLSRGGLIPAVMLSHMTDIPLFPVKYSSKSGHGDNKNHDNHLPFFPMEYESGAMRGFVSPTLLVVDDISDSGKTLREVIDFYRNEQHTVYSAALYYKELSTPVVEPDIYWRKIPEDGPWIIFPWE
jgi:hypoxanthine phosphoribosyltransferase